MPARAYMVPQRDIVAERAELELFLTAIEDQIDQTLAVDPNATVQVYVWDTLTFEHLTRVIGRHLAWLLASGNIATLAWLFPPDDVVANARLARCPAVSVVGDAVRAIVATDRAHAYTLLETARAYHQGGDFNPNWLNTPPYWTTEFSDQIPGERAFDIWTRRNRPDLPFTTLVGMLERTVKARLSALQTVTRRLRDDLHGRLPRKAPKATDLVPPGHLSGSSLLGSLLYTHARLNAAAAWHENSRLRAMPPHEREARFASIRCPARLSGDEETAALGALGRPPARGRLVYQVAPGSTEAKAEVGGFGWAISPERQLGLLDRSLWADNLQGQPWWQSRPPWVNSYEDALQVTIQGFDRYQRLVAVDLAQLVVVDGLSRAGLVDLDAPCILDPVSKDFFSGKVRDAAQAVKNPPKAAVAEAAVRRALGVTGRGPRRTPSVPAEDFLWDAAPLAAALVARPTAGLQTALRARMRAANEPDLNIHQWDAWEHALTRRLTLIWGPPGTGKSRTLGVVLDGVTLDAADEGRPTTVLLTAYTYTAIDNVLTPYAARNPEVTTFRVRSGRARAAPGRAGGIDVSTDDPQDMGRVAVAIAGPGPVVLGATPQQAQKVIEQLTGSAAGELFDFVVIDEAGQMDVAHALLVLAGVTARAQVVVAGDPLQLPPIHHVDPPEPLAAEVGPIYSFYRDRHGVPEKILLTNYRSNAEIVELARYAGYPPGFMAAAPALCLPAGPAPTAEPSGWPPRIDWNPGFVALSDPGRPVMCVTYPEGVAGQWNQFEADLTVGTATLIAQRLERHLKAAPPDWLWTRGLGVVTPHRAQRSLVDSGLREVFGIAHAAEIHAAVDTVERFQGQERWVILASYAVGDPDTVADEAEFLQNLNRFNVLATRAKAKVVVFISDELLAHIATDIEVIRASKLIKSFADTYCNQAAPLIAIYHDPHRGAVPVPLTLRWRA